MKTEKTIMVSGGFDPLHVGPVQMIPAAADHGGVIVVVNSDDWLIRKKGYVFMPMAERCKIIAALRDVSVVYPMKSGLAFYHRSYSSARHYIVDDDNTAIAALRAYRPDYFANGGDRTKKNVPEQPVCDELGIEMLWGVGGEDKPQASSALVKHAMEQLNDCN